MPKMLELMVLLSSSPIILDPHKRGYISITKQLLRQLIFQYLFTTVLNNMVLK
ncbi:hypothetical protein ES703_62175 [subsurface metagenome]